MICFRHDADVTDREGAACNLPFATDLLGAAGFTRPEVMPLRVTNSHRCTVLSGGKIKRMQRSGYCSAGSLPRVHLQENKEDIPVSEVRITVREHGPYYIQGRVILVDHEGNEIPYEGEELWLCRCGGSAKKPFCDGTHKRIGFRGDLGVEIRRQERGGSGESTSMPMTTGEQSRNTEFVAVMPLAEVPEATIVRFEVDGEPRILVRYGDRLYAVHGICTHEEAELAEGDLENGIVYCPLHGSGFELATGRVVSLPATDPLPVYEVHVRDGMVYVSRPPRG